VEVRASLPALSPALAALAAAILLQGCSGDDAANPIQQDTTPPARVDDLSYFRAGYDAALIWTAPGDDGEFGQATTYDIRYSPVPLTEGGWDSATAITSPPTPAPAGEVQFVDVSSMPDGTWHFGLKAADEAPNWSELSNVVRATVVDTVPPARVTDLVVASVTELTVRLTWSAPGDDGSAGRAVAYDLRHALFPITEDTWDEAVRVERVPVPRFGRAPESFDVTGLEPGTPYSFALRTADEVPNWSELSNVVSGSPGDLTQLTFSSRASGAIDPDWSPNADRIAFRADWIEERRFQVYVIPVTGGEAVQLTDIAGGAFNPAWSPDGTRLAFVSSDLFVIDAVPGAEPISLASHGDAKTIGSPSWSPDGNRIAYRVQTFDPPTFVAEIYTVSSQGGTPERLYTENSYMSSLDWSPDGRHIAFASDRSLNGNNDIWLLPVDGGETVLLTDDPASDSSPAWSPDGSLIAFQSDRSGSYDIWVMSSTGLDPVQLTFESIQTGPSWSPGGQQICFGAWDAMGISDIWILGVE
jgi:dipeptidyl aminopeptidase/acylaminoacyl peptidase